MVEDAAFYHCGHFWTLQCISKWGNGDFIFFGEYDLLTYLTWIVRCERNRMERSGGALLSCEETGA